MLVFAKNPRGVLYLFQYQIWGRETGRKPCDIPFEIYKTNRSTLEDAPYREKQLSNMFGKPFPEIAFTYSELRYVPDKTLDLVGPLMVSNYRKSWSHKKKVDQIKIAITEKSPCH